MAKLSEIANESYDYNSFEKKALEACRALLNDGAVIIAFPIREKNGGKRWGVTLFTKSQLTRGLGADYATYSILQGPHESEESFLARVEVWGIDRKELIERTTKK